MSKQTKVGPASELTPRTITRAGKFAVGNRAEPGSPTGDYFAVTRRCRHLGADLSQGKLDEQGCLVCPWHQSAYDVDTGRMVRGPQGAFAKVPGLGGFYRALTKVLPLGRGTVTERGGDLYVS
jgi:3-phenylpropionate/trans-cinnamate dioxygenase ferredoxin component